MCIRDRVLVAATPASLFGVVVPPSSVPVSVVEPVSVVPEPVSYTHLRAHETVLDLVCRLLLEKKNH